MKTYWNGDGKYQDWYDKIADTMPSMYDTDNSNMNLFIYMSRLYYDIYIGNCETGSGLEYK